MPVLGVAIINHHMWAADAVASQVVNTVRQPWLATPHHFLMPTGKLASTLSSTLVTGLDFLMLSFLTAEFNAHMQKTDQNITICWRPLRSCLET